MDLYIYYNANDSGVHAITDSGYQHHQQRGVAVMPRSQARRGVRCELSRRQSSEVLKSLIGKITNKT